MGWAAREPSTRLLQLGGLHGHDFVGSPKRFQDHSFATFAGHVSFVSSVAMLAAHRIEARIYLATELTQVCPTSGLVVRRSSGWLDPLERK